MLPCSMRSQLSAASAYSFKKQLEQLIQLGCRIVLFINNSGFHGAHLDKSLALNFENDFSKCSLKRDFVQILLNWGGLGGVVEK